MASTITISPPTKASHKTEQSVKDLRKQNRYSVNNSSFFFFNLSSENGFLSPMNFHMNERHRTVGRKGWWHGRAHRKGQSVDLPSA